MTCCMTRLSRLGQQRVGLTQTPHSGGTVQQDPPPIRSNTQHPAAITDEQIRSSAALQLCTPPDSEPPMRHQHNSTANAALQTTEALQHPGTSSERCWLQALLFQHTRSASLAKRISSRLLGRPPPYHSRCGCPSVFHFVSCSL